MKSALPAEPKIRRSLAQVACEIMIAFGNVKRLKAKFSKGFANTKALGSAGLFLFWEKRNLHIIFEIEIALGALLNCVESEPIDECRIIEKLFGVFVVPIVKFKPAQPISVLLESDFKFTALRFFNFG